MKRDTTPEQKAAIVSDAHLLGVADTARKYSISRRTVHRYMTDATQGMSPIMSPPVTLMAAERIAKMQKEIEEDTVKLMKVATQSMLSLLQDPDTKESTKLNLYKILTDRKAADTVTAQILGADIPMPSKPELKLVTGGK